MVEREPLPLKVRLFGPFELWCGNRQIQDSDWPRRKTQLLFKCLVSNRGRIFSKDQLIDALFGHLDVDKASLNLYNRISELRKVLEPDLPKRHPSAFIERIGTGDYRFVDTDLCWVDAESFQRHAETAQELEQTSRWSEAIEQYNKALQLYRGEYLAEDLYEEWTQATRQYLAEKHLDIIEGLIRCHEETAQYTQVINFCKHLIELQPARESAYQAWMKAAYQSGQPEQAAQIYDQCVGALKQHLDISPSLQITQLLEKIQSGDVPEKQQTAPNNLPKMTTSFIGRADSLQWIDSLLVDEGKPLVTLVGPGGIGKTRLALEAASHQLDRFDDGVFWMDLSPLTSINTVVTALADVVHFTFHGPRDPKEQLFEYFAQQKILLVMDNAEHLVDKMSQWVQELLDAAPDIQWLITSRERLKLPVEVVLEIRGMPVPEINDPHLAKHDIIQLFLDRIHHIDPRFALTPQTLPFVLNICELVEGMPLGVELAIAWTRLLSLDEIGAEIAESVQALSVVPLSEDAEPKRNLEAVFDWSWSLMSEQERQIFANLTVFRGGFTREAANQVADADLSALAALLDKSLLYRREGSRYYIHEVLRQYGQGRLENEVFQRRRHLTYFSGVAEKAEPLLQSSEQTLWLNRLKQEQDNFRAAMAWALEGHDLEQGARLAGNLGRFWESRSHFAEGRQWLNQAVAVKDLSASTRAKVLMWCGWMASFHGDRQLAQTYTEMSLPLYQRLNDQRGIAWVLNNLGNQHFLKADYRQAQTYFEESAAIQEELGHQEGVAFCMTNLGLTTAAQGQFEAAEDYFKKSLKIRHDMGDHLHIAWNNINLSYVLMDLQKYDQAIFLLEEGKTILEDMEDKMGTAVALSYLGTIYMNLDQLDRAESYQLESLKLRQEINETRGIIISFNQLGQLSLLQNDIQAAKDFFQQSLTVVDQDHDKRNVANSLLGMAQVYTAEKEYESSAKLMGGFERLLSEINSQFGAMQQLQLKQLVATLEDAQSKSSLDHMKACGQKLSMESLIELALKGSLPGCQSSP